MKYQTVMLCLELHISVQICCSCKGSTIRQGQAVVLRSIQDHITTVGTYYKSSGSIIKQTGEVGDKSESLSVGPQGVYHGHDNTIEDVAFSPTSALEFCSVW